MKPLPSFFELFGESGVTCFRRGRVSVDWGEPGTAESEREGETESGFEDPKPSGSIISLKSAADIPSIFAFFIDGSRRLQIVADIAFGRSFYPVVAGQIGVALTTRDRSKKLVKPVPRFCAYENVVALPRKLGDELPDIERRLRDHGFNFRVLGYEPKEHQSSTDAAIVRIMERMLDRELDTVREVAELGMLAPDRLLVRDGPLQFRRPLPNLPAFRNVVGVSKTFSSNAPLKRGARPLQVGSLVHQLDIHQRTSVYCYHMTDKKVAFWYLRLHPRSRMPNPLDGVVKVERIAQEEDIDRGGIDSDLANVISAHLTEERNVAAYQSDSRWANHIYPVYLTEKYLKCGFQSDIAFSRFFGK